MIDLCEKKLSKLQGGRYNPGFIPDEGIHNVELGKSPKDDGKVGYRTLQDLLQHLYIPHLSKLFMVVKI